MEGLMTIADDVLHEVNLKGGRTAEELAALIFGRDQAYPQRIYPALRQLLAESKIVRQGKGGWGHEYTYHRPPIERRF
jgi:hypothetical protein